ncbi:MAG: type I-U CRISPR-associated helicase/endonuclease Cas3 [Thermoguttaceae bacterium]|jgi:CRISPR-associated endonuclease/helicase Cas3
MNDSELPFASLFQELTGNPPFPWQEELYDRFKNGDIPPSCNLPTGLGKTAIIAIWLIALGNAPGKVPRRLTYVVNRRTVVDQSTVEAGKIRDQLTSTDRSSLVEQLANRLAALAANPTAGPLAISTLRGQFADNGEWAADPARPAIIVGTVDMIGSRLLFSGYGLGFKTKPLHAGFLGQDALLVHDEAHLEPAFQKLAEAIEREQHQGERTGELPWPKLCVLALSATARGGDGDAQVEECKAFELTDQEKQPADVIPDPPTEPIHYVWRRLKATKSLRLHQVAGDKAAEQIAELALENENSDAAVLVYVRTIDDVLRVCAKLTDKKAGVAADRVQQLTGTMRGYERDQLVKSDRVFARFMPPSGRSKGVTPREGTVYLVCTSAGEVGVNLSADHMVCDLSTFESMAQRFGRVNRFGDGEARIDVVYPEKFDEKDKLAPARQATLELLHQLDGDASPLALGRLDPAARREAFAAEPAVLPATDILFDAWALTTIREPMPGRPPVAAYLHGIAEWEPPETDVAWREEVRVVTGDVLDYYEPEDLLEDYPLKPHELLRDRSDRVFDKLQVLAGRHPNAPTWIVDEQGRVTSWPLTKFADPSATKTAARNPLIARIARCTVLLPPIVGGLSRGMLDGASDHADDVADIDAPATERRIRLWSDNREYDKKAAGMRLVRSIDPNHDDEHDDGERRTWDWYKQKPLEGTRTAQRPVRWDIHVGDVVRHIDGILAGLSLPDEITQAVRLAAKLHDHGKRRSQFQFMLGNRAYPELVWAKSGRSGAKLPETYRHEFGSLGDAMEDAEFRQLSPEMQDVVLHLVAAHHGRARPHFPIDEAFDLAPGRIQADAELASEVARRFARLQRRYGRWGLAYVESLLRAADWAASAEPSEFVTETKEASQ